MTQKQEILAHLQSGKSITPIEALNEYGCFRLADRIFVLKGEGHQISKEFVTHPDTKKRFARYWMEAQ